MILFLDFDGVLHPWFPRADRSDDENLLRSYLPRLERVLRDYPAVQVVIASDWRLKHSLAELRSMFSPDIQPRVIGVTALTRPPDEPGSRQQQVEEYLAISGESGTPWVALDDHAMNYLPDAPLVVCDDGFRDAEEAALRALLDDAPLSDLLAKGEEVKLELCERAGGTLSAREVAKLLDTSYEAVGKRHCEGRLLAVKLDAEFRYPLCQFSTGRLATGVLEILEILGAEEWTALEFMITPVDELGGETGLQAVASSDPARRERALRLARIAAGEGMG